MPPMARGTVAYIAEKGNHHIDVREGRGRRRRGSGEGGEGGEREEEGKEGRVGEGDGRGRAQMHAVECG